MLTVENLSFERNEQILFGDLTFTLHPGDLLQVQGKNGSGKSTLLRVLAGYLDAYSGRMAWKNQAISAAHSQELHYISHQNSIKSYLTVAENLLLHRAFHAIDFNLDQLRYAAQRVSLQDFLTIPAAQLSQGQLRRLCLARLLLSQKPLWILDEPLTALDTQGQLLFEEILKEHLANKGIAIIATHHELGFGKRLMLSQ